MKIKNLGVILIGFLIASSGAQASLLDDKNLAFRVFDVNTGLTFIDPANGVYLVDPSHTYLPPHASVIFSDANIDITYTTPLAWNSWVGYEFSDADGTIDAFTQATFNPITNIPGLDSSRISFDANHIWISMGGVTASQGSRLSIDVASVAAPIPEPGTCVLMLTSLGLLGFVARRRNRKAA